MATSTENKINQLEQTIKNAKYELDQLKTEYKKEQNSKIEDCLSLSAQEQRILDAIEELHIYAMCAGIEMEYDDEDKCEVLKAFQVLRNNYDLTKSGYLLYVPAKDEYQFLSKTEFQDFVNEVIFEYCLCGDEFIEYLNGMVFKVSRNKVKEVYLQDLIRISIAK